MVNNSKIEWTDGTWNPVTGCTKVSPGCDRCYAEAITNRFKHHPFTQVTLHPDRLDQPARLQRGRRIFVCSMGDLFHKDVPWEFIIQVFQAMEACPQHTFQVLTKRPGRMAHFANWIWPDAYDSNTPYWPENVWAGVSVDTQRTARWLDVLARVPAPVRFVSYEPALGPVDFTPWLGFIREDGHCSRCGYDMLGKGHRAWMKPCSQALIHWLIAGGESGPGARPSHPDWFRRVRDDCAIAGVPFFFKQWGAWRPLGDGEDWGLKEVAYVKRNTDMIPSAAMVRVGKKAAGALLDGREHREFPRALEVANA